MLEKTGKEPKHTAGGKGAAVGRDGGGGKEASPEEEVLGLNFVHNDLELQIRQLPSFPLASLIYFGNFI